jgi:predicted DNA-binding protein YlxM (UPF0122 family)
MKKVFIPKETLVKLYFYNKMSTEQIGKLYHCSHATILNKLKIYRLKRRSKLGLRKSILVPKSELKKLYLNKKYSVAKIAKEMKCSRWPIQKLMKKYKIIPRTLSEAQMKYPKQNFSDDPVEKAYLIGFRLGDLSVMPAKLQIQVECSTSRKEQVRLIKNLFSKYGRIILRKNRFVKGQLVTDIRCLLNSSFKFLLPNEDRIEPWIFKNKKFFFSFLAGYIDAEGHIFTRIYKNSKTPTAGLEISSCDKNILKQIWLKLNEFGIKCQKPRIKTPKGHISKNGIINREDFWRLSVNRKKALFFLFNSIEPYIKHGKRKKDLLKAKNNLLLRLKN